MGLSGTSSI